MTLQLSPRRAHDLLTDAPFSSRAGRYDARGIYCGPPASAVADFVEDDPTRYLSGPLVSERARLLLASAAFAVLKYADRYDAIIGEDTSGRYPALIVGGAMNDIRAHQELSPALRLFASGRIDSRKDAVRWQLTPGDKALVVTEYVAGGGSTRTLHDVVIDQTHTAPDFLVLGGMPEVCAKRDSHKQTRRDSIVFTGDPSCDADHSDIHFAVGPTWGWKGVAKFTGNAHSHLDSRVNRKNVAGARREAALFQALLVEQYLAAVETEQQSTQA